MIGNAEELEGLLVPLRWWHLPQVMRLERELFGDEQWSEESFWSELAYCPPSLLGDSPRSYWAVLDAADPPSGTERRATGGTVLGYGGLAVSADEAYVQTLGVDRRRHRHGIGSRLLARLLQTAREAGSRSCWLEVRADNPAAQAMYTRFGFESRGRRRGYYQPSGTDAIVMAVDLDGGGP